MTDADPTLPEQIGPYRITGRAGMGGMGEVLRGHDDRLDRPVALKRIRPDARDPEQARQRFRREARASARLSHSAIVQVYDWVESDGQDWLVMELVDGRTVAELIADGPLPPEQAVAIARHVAEGLAVAHEAGLVHRDLKASNVIVTANGVAKILDFGVAKAVRAETFEEDQATLLTTLTGEGQIVGTIPAMSPEQALGRPVDHRSDLFSLGTLLYEMLSGVLPFKGGSRVETLTRICSAKETPLSRLVPEVPGELSRLVGRLLKKEPSRRPADARQVVAELDRLAAPPAVASETLDLPTVTERPAGVSQAKPPREGISGTVPVVKASETYFIRKVPGRWVLAAAVVLLTTIGLVGLSSWMRSPAEMAPDGGAAGRAAQPPEAELSSHDLYQRGMDLLERYDKKGNIDKAIADFQRALAQDGNYAPALAGLGSAYRLDYFRGSRDPQRLEQALAAAEKAVEVEEHLAVARVSLGMVYFEMGHHEDAVRELEAALQIEPLNGDARFGLGKVAEAQANLPHAEEHFLRAIDAQPGNWVFHTHLGSLYYNAGRYEEAESAFLRHLELTPDSYTAFRNLGATYYMMGRLAEAATQFQEALRIQPEPTVYSNLGTIYFAQGLYAQSVSAFEKAIKSGGSNDYRQWANLGDAYRWTPDNEPQAREAYLRALHLLTAKLDQRPQDTNLRTLLPQYLAKRGDCDRASAEIATLGQLPGDDANAWYQLAVANEICDRRTEALAALEMALQAGYPIEEVRRDPELLELRQDIRYQRFTLRLQPPSGG